MASRALRILLPLSLSSAAAQVLAGPAQAEEGEPRIISAGRDASGEHAIMVWRGQEKPPAIYVGKKGELRQVEVLSAARTKDAFHVDTIEAGELIFSTNAARVVKPGGIGFNQKLGRVLSDAPDPEVISEVKARFVAKYATPEGAAASAPAHAAHATPTRGLSPSRGPGRNVRQLLSGRRPPRLARMSAQSQRVRGAASLRTKAAKVRARARGR